MGDKDGEVVIRGRIANLIYALHSSDGLDIFGKLLSDIMGLCSALGFLAELAADNVKARFSKKSAT